MDATTQTKFEYKLYPMMIESVKFKLLENMRGKDKLEFFQMFHQVNGSLYSTDSCRAVKISNFPALPDGVYEIISFKHNKLAITEFILRSKDMEPHSISLTQVWFKNPVKIANIILGKESKLTSVVLDVYNLTKRAVNVEFFKDMMVTKHDEPWELLVESGTEENSGKPLMLRGGVDKEIEVIILPYEYEPAKKEK